MKLTKEKRLALIAEWEGRITQKGLAKKYGLTADAVAGIIWRARRSSVLIKG